MFKVGDTVVVEGLGWENPVYTVVDYSPNAGYELENADGKRSTSCASFGREWNSGYEASTLQAREK